MTLTNLVTELLRKPLIAKLDLPTPEKKKLVKDEITRMLDLIIAEYDFPFTRGESTFTTIADVSDYVLKGEKSDCRDVTNMRYGTTNRPLKEWRPVDYDRRYANEATATDIVGWYTGSHSGQYPRVTILGTIGGGTVITYRYTLRNFTMEMYPEDWLYVLKDLVVSVVFPDNIILARRATRSQKKMIKHFEKGGGEENPIVMSKAWRSRNIERNKSYGF